MKKILIIQPACPPYRVAFFLALATKIGEFSLLHFGSPIKFNEDSGIEEIQGDLIKIGNLNYIKNLHIILKDFNLIISVFDPHWINAFLLPVFYPNKKILLWGHGMGNSKLINKIRIILLNKAAGLITYNQAGKDDFVNEGIPSFKVFVAPNSQKVPNSQNTSKYPKNSFLFVGRLQRRKKIDLLLKAFKENQFDIKGYVINIIGNGREEKEFLQRQVEDLGITESVKFINGTIDDDVLLSNFQKAFAYVSPGAVGLGVLHSFAYGVPVVTIKNMGHGPEASNILNFENGIIGRDYEDFSFQLNEIIKNDLYKYLGDNAFTHFKKNRSIENMVQGFLKAINFVS